MAVPDWLYNTMVKIGLQDSDEIKLKKQIAAYEEKRRNLNQEFDRYIKQIRNLEAHIKVLRPEYESAHGAEKNLLAAKIKPLLQELEQMKEKESLTSQHIKDLTSLIHNYDLQLQNMQNATLTDDMEEAFDQKQELIADMKDQQRVSDKLNSVSLTSNEETPDFSALSSNETVNSDIDNFFKSMDNEKKNLQEEA